MRFKVHLHPKRVNRVITRHPRTYILQAIFCQDICGFFICYIMMINIYKDNIIFFKCVYNNIRIDVRATSMLKLVALWFTNLRI